MRVEFGQTSDEYGDPGSGMRGKISIGASLLNPFSLHHQKAITTKWLVNQIFLVVHVAG